MQRGRGRTGLVDATCRSRAAVSITGGPMFTLTCVPTTFPHAFDASHRYSRRIIRDKSVLDGRRLATIALNDRSLKPHRSQRGIRKGLSRC